MLPSKIAGILLTSTIAGIFFNTKIAGILLYTKIAGILLTSIIAFITLHCHHCIALHCHQCWSEPINAEGRTMSFASLFFFSETFPNHKPTMNNADDNLNDHHHQDQL